MPTPKGWLPAGRPGRVDLGPYGRRGSKDATTLKRHLPSSCLRTNNAKLEMPVTALRLLGDAAAIVDVISRGPGAPLTAVQGEPLTTWSWSSTVAAGWSRVPTKPSAKLQPITATLKTWKR